LSCAQQQQLVYRRDGSTATRIKFKNGCFCLKKIKKHFTGTDLISGSSRRRDFIIRTKNNKKDAPVKKIC